MEKEWTREQKEKWMRTKPMFNDQKNLRVNTEFKLGRYNHIISFLSSPLQTNLLDPIQSVLFKTQRYRTHHPSPILIYSDRHISLEKNDKNANLLGSKPFCPVQT